MTVCNHSKPRNIPYDAMLNICAHLDLTSLARLYSTCKDFRKFLNKNDSDINKLWLQFVSKIAPTKPYLFHQTHRTFLCAEINSLKETVRNRKHLDDRAADRAQLQLYKLELPIPKVNLKWKTANTIKNAKNKQIRILSRPASTNNC